MTGASAGPWTTAHDGARADLRLGEALVTQRRHHLGRGRVGDTPAVRDLPDRRHAVAGAQLPGEDPRPDLHGYPLVRRLWSFHDNNCTSALACRTVHFRVTSKGNGDARRYCVRMNTDTPY